MTVKSSPLYLLLIIVTGSLAFGCQKPDQSIYDLPVAQHVDLEDIIEASPTDSLSLYLFQGVMAFSQESQLSNEPIGVIIQQVGTWFMDSPYVAGTLDHANEEKLVIKLDGYDCVTFVESTLALSRTIAEGSTSFEDFSEKMIEQRYRESKIEGYCSRLHYFSEWIYTNAKRGLVEDITEQLGGVKLEKTLNFMSTHRDSYPQLASNEALFAELIEVEKGLINLDIFYIPQGQIREKYNALQEGDIIALATDIKGLDVVHTGFVFKTEEGGTGLMHASTTKGVTVSPDLQDYVENNKRQIGILVARPKG